MQSGPLCQQPSPLPLPLHPHHQFTTGFLAEHVSLHPLRRTGSRPARIPPAAANAQGQVLLPVDTYASFPSKYAKPRRVDMMLPPGYPSAQQQQQQQWQQQQQRHPVIYFHDGQNCVDPSTSFSGVDWGIDQALLQLMEQGELQVAPICVFIWNTGDERRQEYMPAEPLRWLSARHGCWYDEVEPQYYHPTSDLYLKMLVEEVKPFVDANYRTRPDARSTAVIGSSMGGLISLYALQQYPEVFGGAGCLSTHWVPGRGLVVGWMKAGHVPRPKGHRLYFDHGTEGSDSEYGVYQAQVDELLLEAGFKMGDNLHSQEYSGETHHESAWRKRVGGVMKTLLQ